VERTVDPDEFVESFNTQLTYLIAFARAINELNLAGALFGEARGAQDAGWNTSVTALEVFYEMRDLGTRDTPLTITELRQFLCL
jgi:hypothetical protein